MTKFSVAEAKARLSEILSKVEAGDEVLITRRGEPVARIVAVSKSRKSLPPLSEFRATLPKAKTSSVKIIRQMRDESY